MSGGKKLRHLLKFQCLAGYMSYLQTKERTLSNLSSRDSAKIRRQRLGVMMNPDASHRTTGYTLKLLEVFFLLIQ